jgi:peptide/nickel transport system permease protein
MMLLFLGRRVAQIVPNLLLISVLCFALMHVVPGGPTGTLAENPKVSAEDIARIRANFGLDRPWPVQYLRWLERVTLHGDFGRSYVTGEPVLPMIVRRVPATLELMGSAFIIALLGALAIAVLSALRPHARVDGFFVMMSLVLLSIPVFWSGLMAMMLFCVHWKLLPSAGMATIGAPFSLFDHLRHLILPSMVLALVFIATWSRYLRATLTQVLDERFIDVARAKGLSRAAVVLRHGLRSAAAPALTVVALNLPLLFTGSIIVETIFSWPGMGRLFFEGLLRMDYSRLMGIVFFASVLVALFNLIADIIHGLLDPRIKYA